jgi:hypothetical protein
MARCSKEVGARICGFAILAFHRTVNFEPTSNDLLAKMRLAIVAVVFATVVAAKPWPWAAPAASIVPTANKPHNRTQRGNRTSHHHHEPTPTFKQACDCPQPIVPMNLLSQNEVSASTFDGYGMLTGSRSNA